MEWLAFVPAMLNMFSAFTSNAEKEGRLERKQYEAQAKAESASAQREGIERQRQSDILASRALAISAASGGGALDPTVVNIIAGLDASGNYGARSAIYGGETAAAGLRFKGALSEYSGKAKKRAEIISALGGSASSLSDMGGIGGPEPKTGADYTDGLTPSLYEKYA